MSILTGEIFTDNSLIDTSKGEIPVEMGIKSIPLSNTVLEVPEAYKVKLYIQRL